MATIPAQYTMVDLCFSAGATVVIKTTHLSLYGGTKDFTYTYMELIWHTPNTLPSLLRRI